MDTAKLKEDWETNPQLKHLAFAELDQVVQHLRKCHNEMMAGGMGCIGYLYVQQTLRVRELKKELERI